MPAETEIFARRMRELKERAGLSYGSLGRTLHTSTSTLHRYCNGEAVPTEFATVDRFARACGATREEAVDLHRAWLLADARRGARSFTEPVVEPRVEPVVEREPVVRRPWYRRRRSVAVVAAGAVAGAVAVGMLAAAGPEPRTPQARTPQAGPTQGAAPASPAPAPVTPLKAVVRSHVWAAGCDHAYLSTRAPATVPPPPVEADAPAWARAQGAVHARTQIVEVTVHGTGEGAVVLQDLEVRVAARRTPPAWNVYQMSQGCGGALTPAGFAVNLDAPRPLARAVAGNDSGEPVPAPAFPLRVSAAEPAVLRVEAAATGCDCDWYLDLRWTGPGGSGTLRLDDNGVPWRTSATTGRPEYGFASELGRWAS
ncbi:helix-turn-helix domain-containing protein [Streptomyces sp. NPDC003042]